MKKKYIPKILGTKFGRVYINNNIRRISLAGTHKVMMSPVIHIFHCPFINGHKI